MLSRDAYRSSLFCGDVDRYSKILISVVYPVISTHTNTAADVPREFLSFGLLEIWLVVAKGDNEPESTPRFIHIEITNIVS